MNRYRIERTQMTWLEANSLAEAETMAELLDNGDWGSCEADTQVIVDEGPTEETKQENDDGS